MKQLNLLACASVLLAFWTVAAPAQEGGAAIPQIELGGDDSPAEIKKQAQQAMREFDYARAAALFDLLVQAEGTAENWTLLGEAYYDLERFEESYKALETALEIDPRYARAVAMLEVVRSALPQPTFEDDMQKRFLHAENCQRADTRQLLYRDGDGADGFS